LFRPAGQPWEPFGGPRGRKGPGGAGAGPGRAPGTIKRM
jgi:hypothetical protein